MFFEDLVYMMGSAIISGLGHNLTLSLVHLYSLYFMPIAYYIIVENHSTTPKEDYTIIGFVDDDGGVDGTAGTLLSPPRVTYSKFWITMSYLKVNLYLVALYLAICSISNLLITRIGHLTLVVQYLPVILYLAGFSFYTYRVFNYRTNILLTVAMLFGIPAVLQDFYHFVVLGTAVLAISCHFLQYGGEIVSAVEETSGAPGGPVAFTSVTGTGSDA